MFRRKSFRCGLVVPAAGCVFALLPPLQLPPLGAVAAATDRRSLAACLLLPPAASIRPPRSLRPLRLRRCARVAGLLDIP